MAAAIIHHCGGVLVSYGIFSSLHLLFFDEFIVPSRLVLDIRIVPVMSFFYIWWVSDEHDIALVDCSLIGAAMWPLLVVCLPSADTCSARGAAVLVQPSNWVTTDILRWLGEIKQRWPSWFSSCSNIASPTSQSHRPAFGLAVPHKRLVIGVELELLGQLLLGHVKSLMVHVSLVSTCS